MITKEQLIAKIEELTDEEVLKDLAQVIEFHSGNEQVYHFTEEEMTMIREAEIDIENGNVHTHAEIIEMSKIWLRK